MTAEAKGAKSVAEKKEFAILSPDGDGVFRITRQMDCRNQDIVGLICVRNNAGELVFTDEDKMKAWGEHYPGLLNVEFEWPSNELPDVPPIAGPPPNVFVVLICKILSKMKWSKEGCI